MYNRMKKENLYSPVVFKDIFIQYWFENFDEIFVKLIS